MIKKSKRTETKEVEDITYICDRCGKEAEQSGYHAALHECAICSRCICLPCRIGTDSLQCDDIYVSGDYPYYRVCKVCWETGAKYRHQIDEAYNKFSAIRDTFMEEWKKEATK